MGSSENCNGTKINHYKYEKIPVDNNAAVSNEEEMTSQ
ncbi:hypothetical protein T01_99 [Trichinella spiralis]|uniref:Uncharacterized protein n=1 Tax=Trichinella spiralis TaxID=6334 RepID=A0A0V0YR32_TRISP|nr:hypothetical protein T01_99 [Trichinella spiralis]